MNKHRDTLRFIVLMLMLIAVVFMLDKNTGFLYEF